MKEGKNEKGRKAAGGEKREERGELCEVNASMKCLVPCYLLYLLRCNYAVSHIARRGKRCIVGHSCASVRARARLYHSHYRNVDARESTIICGY